MIIAYFHPSIVAAILFALLFIPSPAVGHAALPPPPPPATRDASPPRAVIAPPIIASSQSPPPSLSLYSRPVTVVTAIADASKRGPSLSCADAAPMSQAGAAPAASYKAEAKSKVEAEARLSVSQVNSKWAASSPRSCCWWGRLPSQTPRATGPGHYRHCGRGAHRGPPPSNSPTVIGLASK